MGDEGPVSTSPRKRRGLAVHRRPTAIGLLFENECVGVSERYGTVGAALQRAHINIVEPFACLDDGTHEVMSPAAAIGNDGLK
ncbi:hypothetical protein D3C86_1053550 [compost metagenome]